MCSLHDEHDIPLEESKANDETANKINEEDDKQDTETLSEINEREVMQMDKEHDTTPYIFPQQGGGSSCSTSIIKFPSSEEKISMEPNRRMTRGRDSICGRRETVSVSRVKLDVNRTVAARLDQLEDTQTLLMESLSTITQLRETQSTKRAENIVEKMSNRLHAVESFLRGFEHVDMTNISPLRESKLQLDSSENIEADLGLGLKLARGQTSQENSSDEDDDIGCSESHATLAECIIQEDANEDINADNSGDTTRKSLTPLLYSSLNTQLNRSSSLLFHLNERECRTELFIEDLARQLVVLREKICELEEGGSRYNADKKDFDGLWERITELTDSLQKQIADIMTTVCTKVTITDYNAETQAIRKILESCGSTPERIGASKAPNELWIVKGQIMDQVDELNSTKLDRAEFEQQLEQKEIDLKSLLEQEISKQKFYLSSNVERIAHDLEEVRSMMKSQKDALSRLHNRITEPSSASVSLETEDLDARIQQATDVVKAYLEDTLTKRLEELRSIESEMDGLTSKLAEKPSQDQIDSMLRDLEDTISKRLGQDKTLQLIIENMKIGRSSFHEP